MGARNAGVSKDLRNTRVESDGGRGGKPNRVGGQGPGGKGVVILMDTIPSTSSSES